MLAKDWQHAGGARDLQSATVFPESCHSVTLAKVLLFVRAVIFRKKVTAALSFSGRKHIGFLDSKSGPPQYIQPRDSIQPAEH